MIKHIIHSDHAPQAIGPYSQAIRADRTVYLSGQIPLVPATMQLVSSDISAQIEQVLQNLTAVVAASGGALTDIVKLNVYLTDLQYFDAVNAAMMRHFTPPYPARAVVQVGALPRGSLVEIDGVMVL